MTAHLPVLENEAIEWLIGNRDGLYVDATLGGGSHARRLLRELSPLGRVWGFDWDADALAIARENLADELERVRVIQAPFSRIGEFLDESRELADGILADTGMSSIALDNSSRGFQYRAADSPLDMRMDRRRPRTAARFLNESSETEMIEVFRDLGGVRRPHDVARAVIHARSAAEIETTGDLIRALRRGRISTAPADLSRLYQSLRMSVNEELKELDALLAGAALWLKPGGRLVVISFESLSDRRVKSLARAESPEGRPLFRRLTRRVVRPGPEEARRNPRSRSAKLRAFERTS